MRRRRRIGGAAEAAPVVEASGEDSPRGDAPSNKPRGGEEEPSSAAPRPAVAWGNVVEDSLRVGDPAELARRLRDELTLGDGRTSYGRVLEALDRSARNYDDAGRLWRAARVEEERYKLECSERIEVMRSSALAELMAEYHRKERRSPTNDDIEDRMVSSWPDEYSSIKARLAELHAAVASLEILVSAWSSRCADLRIMADKARPV